MTTQNSIAPYDTTDLNGSTSASAIIDPTRQVSRELSFAFDFFNERLFNRRLRRCLVTLQRHRGLGYFAAQRYVRRDGSIVVDEIALNPDAFHERTDKQIFSTLVHEQVHLLQYQLGRPSPNGYHNKQWGDWMERIGLIPSATGKPGGQRTGIAMSHFIDPDGPFDRACTELLATSSISFMDLWSLVSTLGNGNPAAAAKADRRHKSKTASKTRFSCPTCRANAWGNPGLRIDCRPCRLPMSTF